MTYDPTAQEIDALEQELIKDAESHGYHLSPDRDAVRALVRGLIVNTRRYGYPACPCRLSFGKKEEDLDIICPCDFRDPDLDDFGACYCSLYVTEAVKSGREELKPIPERRPPRSERKKAGSAGLAGGFSLPIWRCRVCGYLCAREKPPETCPICKVSQERFERFA
ncbi:ferredoxin:glutaredoxin reductase [Methanocalculus taiwanensis]|uniref:ferredoxin:thioredoxin reductase n=1 Tax=Methanocalculus taiwanensis TaxID=106207 RepID=A0ABD4TN82_9EURY|nr:ferredoxin-thioredoxin reductase catalytic domain-containing protein [Methanocalculus taiwanensis]MCQ1538760.1 ferredoxin:glutaredoxin reductase [Methanocalculus taiwanensis]